MTREWDTGDRSGEYIRLTGKYYIEYQRNSRHKRVWRLITDGDEIGTSKHVGISEEEARVILAQYAMDYFHHVFGREELPPEATANLDAYFPIK